MPPTLASPLTFPVEVRRRSKVMYLPVFKDRGGTPYMDSAKQLLVKPIYEPFAVLMVTGVLFKEPAETDAFCAQYLDKINADGWRGYGAGQAWVMDINTDPNRFNDVDVDEVHVTVACLVRKWNSMFPDVGYVYLDGADLMVFRAKDHGRYIGKLDGAGGKLAISGNMIINEWDYKQEVSFAGLGF